MRQETEKPTEETIEKTIEEWAVELKTPLFFFAAAKELNGWGIEHRCSKETFETAISNAKGLKVS